MTQQIDVLNITFRTDENEITETAEITENIEEHTLEYRKAQLTVSKKSNKPLDEFILNKLISTFTK